MKNGGGLWLIAGCCLQRPDTCHSETLARILGGWGGDRCLFKNRPRFLKVLSARNDGAAQSGAERLLVSILFVLLAALIQSNFRGVIIGGESDGESDGEGGDVPRRCCTFCQRQIMGKWPTGAVTQGISRGNLMKRPY